MTDPDDIIKRIKDLRSFFENLQKAEGIKKTELGQKILKDAPAILKVCKSIQAYKEAEKVKQKQLKKARTNGA